MINRADSSDPAVACQVVGRAFPGSSAPFAAGVATGREPVCIHISQKLVFAMPRQQSYWCNGASSQCIPRSVILVVITVAANDTDFTDSEPTVVDVFSSDALEALLVRCSKAKMYAHASCLILRQG